MKTEDRRLKTPTGAVRGGVEDGGNGEKAPALGAALCRVLLAWARRGKAPSPRLRTSGSMTGCAISNSRLGSLSGPRACLETTSGPAVGDFGCGQDGEVLSHGQFFRTGTRIPWVGLRLRSDEARRSLVRQQRRGIWHCFWDGCRRCRPGYVAPTELAGFGKGFLQRWRAYGAVDPADRESSETGVLLVTGEVTSCNAF
jgi:hypothetical protein